MECSFGTEENPLLYPAVSKGAEHGGSLLSPTRLPGNRLVSVGTLSPWGNILSMGFRQKVREKLLKLRDRATGQNLDTNLGL